MLKGQVVPRNEDSDLTSSLFDVPVRASNNFLNFMTRAFGYYRLPLAPYQARS